MAVKIIASIHQLSLTLVNRIALIGCMSTALSLSVGINTAQADGFRFIDLGEHFIPHVAKDKDGTTFILGDNGAETNGLKLQGISLDVKTGKRQIEFESTIGVTKSIHYKGFYQSLPAGYEFLQVNGPGSLCSFAGSPINTGPSTVAAPEDFLGNTVVGTCYGECLTSGKQQKACSWNGQNTNYFALSENKSTTSAALGINSQGTIVGAATNSSNQTRAFIAINGTTTDLGTFGGPTSIA